MSKPDKPEAPAMFTDPNAARLVRWKARRYWTDPFTGERRYGRETVFYAPPWKGDDS